MKTRRVMVLSGIWLLLLPSLEKGMSIFPKPYALYNAVQQQQPVLLDNAFNEFVDHYGQWLEHRLSDESVPGAALAIVKSGSVCLARGYGVRDMASQEEVDKHTVFRVASLSKGFTGLLSAMMVRDSMIEWGTPLCEELPEVYFKEPEYGEELQLQHLLSHTTGLPRHTYSNLLNMGRSYRNILGMLPLVEPTHPIGSYHNYQNVTFNLAGDMLAATAESSFEALLQQRIFEPLGMQDASASYEGMESSSNRALPCRRIANGYAPAELEADYYAVPAAAGVNASISDMAKYLKMVMGKHPQVTDSSLLAQVFQPYVPIPAAKYMLREWRPLESAHYAMGWRVIEKPGYTIITHSGYVNGYRAEIAFCPEEEVGIVLLSNAPNHTVARAAPAFFERYFTTYAKRQPTT